MSMCRGELSGRGDPWRARMVAEPSALKVVSTSIFGGTSDKRKNINDEAEKMLYIDATSVFGGVEIR